MIHITHTHNRYTYNYTNSIQIQKRSNVDDANQTAESSRINEEKRITNRKETKK